MALVRRTQERLRVGNLQTLSTQERFDDMAYAYVVLAGGMAAVHIVADYGPVSDTIQMVSVDIPDFYSGAVQNGYVETVPATLTTPSYKDLNQFYPTIECAKKFKLAQTWQKPRRLALEPSTSLTDVTNPNADTEANPKIYSQYTRLKPTMYSGQMRHLVQVLMGFGKEPVKDGKPYSRYDPAPEEKTSDKQTKPPTAYEQTVAQNGLQILYDWHFSRTHGLSKGADGTWWLIEIGITNGVLAMPLAFNAASQKAAFLQRMTDAQDTEALEVLNTYGGFPTGECFPTGDALKAWIRAGRVMQLLTADDMHAFYALNPYCTQLGWAFNASGTEAHNTAWAFGDDGVQRGYHYSVPLAIGALRKPPQNSGWTNLRDAFQNLTGSSYAKTKDAAIWKLEWLSKQDVEWANSLLQSGVKQAYDYIDGLVLDGIATHSCELSKLDEGTLWYPPRARIENGTIMRFPEPSLGLLVAHSMKPAYSSAPVPPLCDTMVHVFFAGDEIKWVKFYRDNRAGPGGTTTNDYDPCMFIGTWEQHSDSGSLNVPPMYYTSDFDDRAELAESTSDTTITGRDMGYSSIYAADDILNPSIGIARRRKRFQMKTVTKTVSSPSLSTGIATPFYEREGYYYAVYRSNQGSTDSITYGYQYVGDPWYCSYTRNFPGYRGRWVDVYDASGQFIGWRPISLDDINGYGPNTYRTADPDTPLYDNSNLCCDVADSGPWCEPGDNIDLKLYDIPEPPLPTASTVTHAPTGTYTVWLVTSSRLGEVLATTVSNGSFGQWRLWTPDLQDGFSSDQYIEDTMSCAGQADILRYCPDLNTHPVMRGQPDWPGLDSGFLTFIGVING
jgi:hypothetical protein